jgi:hypothetical protein
MSNQPAEFAEAPLTEAEKHAALFAQLVMQSASMALMLMGKAPNPMTGKTETELDGARLFIEQLEMLEVKTRGNLSQEEQHLLKQNLMHVRMSFVETVNAGKTAPKVEPAQPAASAESEESAHKKFSKSYGEG